MASFITTINLLDADENDLTQLHSVLKKESFRMSMRVAPKINSELQRAEYEKSGNITIYEVMQTVLKAIRQTGKNFPFTVIKQKSV